MLERKTREQLYADKMFFNADSMVPINALHLIEELKKQESLERENAQLKNRIETLEAIVAYYKASTINTSCRYDIRS